MALFALGLNHTTAPLEVRERVAFPPDALGGRAARPGRRAPGEGSRHPVDVQSHRGLLPRRRPDARRALARRIPQPAGRSRSHPYVYTLPQDKAVTHAFRVASGLDSMVLGEPQILGQMKQAVRVGGGRRVAGPRAEPAVPAHVRRGQGRAHADRHRQRVDFDGRSGGEAGRAHLPVDLGPAAAADRRGRNDRARGHALRRQERRSRSPSPTARSNAAASSPPASAPRRSR